MKKGAIGIVFTKDRKQVLLIKRRDVPIWALPGGGIEDDEPAKEAVIRELFEETGLMCQVDRLVGIYEPINFLAKETFVFECSPTSEIPTYLLPQQETLFVAFYPVDKLPQPFFFLHAEWLQAALLCSDAPIRQKMTSLTLLRLIKVALCHPYLLFRYLLSRLGLPVNS